MEIVPGPLFRTHQTMRKRAGIGAVGSVVARFFHPSAVIRARWPNDHQQQRLTGCVVTGKAPHNVNRKNQMCYEVRIPSIDDGTIFHVVCSNFRVGTAAGTPFEDELAPAPRQAAAATNDEVELRTSHANVNRSELAQEVAELRQQGIEVDDDNEPAPENARPTPQPTTQVEEWVTPTV